MAKFDLEVHDDFERSFFVLVLVFRFVFRFVLIVFGANIPREIVAGLEVGRLEVVSKDEMSGVPTDKGPLLVVSVPGMFPINI